MDNGNYVTRKDCEEYRKGIYKRDREQDIRHTEAETKLRIFERLAWTIIGVLVSGFAGVIFAVLSIGGL